MKQRKTNGTEKKKRLAWLWLIPAACCLLYGIRILSIRSGTRFYLVWFALALAFAGVFVLAKKSLWQRAPRALRRAVTVVIAAGLAAFVLVEGLIMTDFFDKAEDGLDYLIVLGAQVRENGPSYVLKQRLNAALDYLKRNPETKCIVSGGQGANEPFPEADGMADYLIANGIDPERIIREGASASTEENIRNSMAFMEPGASAGIVTNNFHVYRALRTAERCGLTNVCGHAGRTTALYLPNNMLREFFGVMKLALTP